MKNHKLIKPVLTGLFFVSVLGLLSGCGLFGPKTSCPACAPTAVEVSSPEDVLFSINGKPAITKASLDDFFEVYLRSRPDGAYAAMDPQAKRNAFNELVQMEVLKHKVLKDKRDQDPKYRKSFQRACDLALYTVNAEILGNEVLDSIDVSDDAVEQFYKDNIGKNPAFDNPPFLKTPEGIKVIAVKFTDEKSAKDFLAKVQKTSQAGFTERAKAINKDVLNLGLVTQTSKFGKNIEDALKGAVFTIRMKVKELQPNAVELVSAQGGPYVVIRAVGARQVAKYADYSEVINDQLKEQLANYKKQVEGQKKFVELLNAWKEELNAVENTAYFEEEEAKKKAELEARFKELQAAQEAQKPAADVKKPVKKETATAL